MLNLKTGKFLSYKFPQQEGGVYGNLLDSKVMLDYYNVPEVEDLTGQVARMITTADPDLTEASFLDRLEAGAMRYTTNKRKIEYRLRGKSNVTFRLTKTINSGTPGLGNGTFSLEWNTNIFKAGDRMSPLEDPLLQVTILDDGRPRGTNTEYKVRFHGDSRRHFFPLVYLRKNTKWVVNGGSTFSEGSRGWGSAFMRHAHSVLKFRVPLFKVGSEMTLTDEVIMQGAVISAEYDPESGKLLEDGTMLATSVMEASFNQQQRMKKDADLTWGIYAQGIPDNTTDRYREIGAGAFDFLRQGHRKRYNPHPWNTSIEEFTDFIDPIMEYTGPQLTVFQAGRPVMELMDVLITRKFGEKSAIRDIGDFLERNGQFVPGGRDAFKLKMPMYNAYELPTRGVVEFDNWASLDDKSRGGPMHPTSGKPVMGYWMIAWDVGFGSGIDSNIALVERRNSRVYGYEVGAVGPTGPVNETNVYQMVHGGRYCILRYGESYGFFQRDLNKSVWFLPNIRK